jgi:hypothetical protein
MHFLLAGRVPWRRLLPSRTGDPMTVPGTAGQTKWHESGKSPKQV